MGLFYYLFKQCVHEPLVRPLFVFSINNNNCMTNLLIKGKRGINDGIVIAFLEQTLKR